MMLTESAIWWKKPVAFIREMPINVKICFRACVQCQANQLKHVRIAGVHLATISMITKKVTSIHKPITLLYVNKENGVVYSQTTSCFSVLRKVIINND